MSTQSNNTFATGNEFGIAVSRLLGIDAGRVTAAKLDTELNTPLTVTITYLVDRKDLAMIAALMPEVGGTEMAP